MGASSFYGKLKKKLSILLPSIERQSYRHIIITRAYFAVTSCSLKGDSSGRNISHTIRTERNIVTIFLPTLRCLQENLEAFTCVGFAPIFPDTCYHLTHYWPAAADIPVASDNPVH
ncbi:hypothetical protein, partial [Escherichia coli]|uniref:hypothetical protein n=1 Tax=Escherichia coli TaxID=562 RepID=UPI003360B980